MSWPEDADGDVFRRLEANGFDFAKPHTVDYDVDFASWPPHPEALEFLRAQYGLIKIYEPDDKGEGYVQFQMTGLITYESVIAIQRRTTSAMRRYGGVCESWGVLQEARPSA